ncbi:MAG TPA: phytanoyl-CoA dioxygenase family protein [Gaiellaceae bacterium]|nr:phytanoyl-CoA dioxygenase family protein [Gaiellaceae bacterium]
MSLTPADVEAFVVRGFVRLEEAFPRELAATCRDLLWEQLEVSEDPATWTGPSIRLGPQTAEPFHEAAHTERLRSAFDQLVGSGRWIAGDGLGGTIVVRFPVEEDPVDAGWHIDGSFPKDNSWWVNVRSEGRSLLMLFLFSDVGDDDAPTRILVGSHLDVPTALALAGDEGMDFAEVTARLPNLGARRLVRATGRAGDVYLCHPFLVHAGDRHRGSTPRFLAQPPLFWREPLDLDAPADPDSPVETAIRIALGLI